MHSFPLSALCPPGCFGRKRKHWKSSSVPGLTPCTTCDYGTYQPKPGQTECSHCPGDWTTLKRGSVDLSDCKGNFGDVTKELPCCGLQALYEDSESHDCHKPPQNISSSMTSFNHCVSI